MYIIKWINSGAYELYDSFLAMLKEMKLYNKAGLRKNIDYILERIEKKPEKRLTEYIAFDQF